MDQITALQRRNRMLLRLVQDLYAGFSVKSQADEVLMKRAKDAIKRASVVKDRKFETYLYIEVDVGLVQDIKKFDTADQVKEFLRGRLLEIKGGEYKTLVDLNYRSKSCNLRIWRGNGGGSSFEDVTSWFY